MKCPHCDKTFIVPDVAQINVENYGSSFFTLTCFHCRKLVRVYGSRKIVFESITKAPPGADDDFGGRGIQQIQEELERRKGARAIERKRLKENAKKVKI